MRLKSRIIVFMSTALALLLVSPLSAEEMSNKIVPADMDTKQAPVDKEQPQAVEKPAPSVMDRTPGNGRKVSMFNTLALDVLLPGGGFFYRHKWIWGAGFAAARIGAGFAAWYYVNEWSYNHSLYDAARRGNTTLDPTHELLFRLPDGSYKTVRQIKRDYDASAQNMTIAFVTNGAILAVSLLLNYQAVKEQNEDGAPSFQAAFAEAPATGEQTFRAAITFRF